MRMPIGLLRHRIGLFLLSCSLLAVFVGSFPREGSASPWLFQPRRSYSTGSPWDQRSPGQVAVIDFDGDGREDILTILYALNPPYREGIVFLQNAQGQLEAPRSFLQEAGSYSDLATGDVNGDGARDIVIGTECSPDQGYIVVLLRADSGGFPVAFRLPSAALNSCSVRLMDMNNDGLLDIAGMKYRPDSISVWYQQPGGTVGTEVVYPLATRQYEPQAAALGDVNGDGLADFVDVGPAGLYIARGTPGGGFEEAELYEFQQRWDAPRYVALGDVNSDGRTDVLIMFRTGLAVRYQEETGGLGEPRYHETYDYSARVFVADVNGDGRKDVITTHSWYAIGVLLQGTDGTLLPQELFGANHYQDFVATGDVNGDGITDLVLTDEAVSVYLGAGGNPTVQVSKTGSGTGVVYDHLPVVFCGNSCEGQTWRGTELSFFAVADPGSRFAGWQGKCTGTGPCRLTVDDDIHLTARFERALGLSVIPRGDWCRGWIVSSPPAIDCGFHCNATFDPGTPVLLEVLPEPGCRLIQWQGGGCTGQGSCVLSLAADTEVSASFSPCWFVLSTHQASFPQEGGSIDVFLSASGISSCWQPEVLGLPSWMSIGWWPYSSNYSVLSFFAAPNPGADERTATLRIGGEAFSVVQEGTPCFVTAAQPASRTLSGQGGERSFQVKTDTSSCAWKASTEVSWIHLNVTEGRGPATIAFAVESNANRKARTATITVASVSNPETKKTVRITQLAGGPSLPREDADPAASEEVGGPLPPPRSGYFRGKSVLSLDLQPSRVTMGDLNGDGRKDLAALVHAFDTTVTGVYVFFQNTRGELDRPRFYSVKNDQVVPTDLRIADMNNDGREDLVVWAGGIGIFYQNSDGTLAPMIFHPMPAEAFVGDIYMALADFNNDGLADVLTMNSTEPWVHLHLGQPDGSFAPTVSYYGPHWGWNQLDAGDVDGDGLADAVIMSTANWAGFNISVLAQTPQGTLASPMYYNAGGLDAVFGFAIGDVDGDGRNDVVVTHGQQVPDTFISIFRQNASGTLHAGAMYNTTEWSPSAVAIGDVDGDGRNDVVVLHHYYGKIGVFLQQESGVFSEEQLYGTNPIPADIVDPRIFAMGDINGDGLPDVAIAREQNQSITLHYNYGHARRLFIEKRGNGSGTVQSNPAGVDYGADCAHVFPPGTRVVLTASPSPGSTFAGWEGEDCTGAGPCTVTMDGDKVVGALFSRPSVTVVRKGGCGKVSSVPAGIDCEPHCWAPYDGGTTVTLKPIASDASGVVFLGWSGGPCSGRDACVITLDADTRVTASFAACTYAVSSRTIWEVSYGGETKDFLVTAAGAPECPPPRPRTEGDWIAARLTNWKGNRGIVRVTTLPNDSALLRTGRVVLTAQATITLFQEGTPCTVEKLAPQSLSFSGDSGNGSFTITTSTADCPWIALPWVSWIHMDTFEGIGTGTVFFAVDKNSGRGARTGLIKVEAGSGGTKSRKTFAIRQTK